MATAFKALVAILSALFIVASGFSVTKGFAGAVEANNYMESVSKLILESYYNEEVIATCVAEAAENGYELTVSVEGGDRAGGAKCAKIEFIYDFELKLFGYVQEKKQMKVL